MKLGRMVSLLVGLPASFVMVLQACTDTQPGDPEGSCRVDTDCTGAYVCCRSAVVEVGDDHLGRCLPESICEAEPCSGEEDYECEQPDLVCCVRKFADEIGAPEYTVCSDPDDCGVFVPPDETTSSGMGGAGGSGGAGGTAGAGGTGGAGGCGVCTVTPGSYPTVDDPEAPHILDYLTFQIVIAATSQVFEEGYYLAMAGSNGQQIHRLSDGSVAYDLTFPNAPNYAVIGANNSLVSISADGYAQRAYDPDSDAFGSFAQLGLIGNNITGISPILASPQSVTGILLSNNSFNRVHRLDPLSGEFGGFTSGGLFIDEVTFSANGLSGNTVVHVYSPMGDGPILGIGDSASAGQPGKLWWHDPANSTSITIVGDLGEGPRRIECLEPAGTPCAVSSFFGGEVTLVDWPNRNAPPTIGTTTVPVAGPVGIDVAMVDGAPTVAATGFNDDTLHLITIGANLTPTDQEVPLSNCTQPGHAAFIPDGSHVVVTCNGSDNFVVLELPIQN